MSKRVIRIDRNQIKEIAPSLVGKDVNIVLTNDHTHFGNLIEVQDNILMLKDLREHLHRLPMEGTVEIIYDEVRPW